MQTTLLVPSFSNFRKCALWPEPIVCRSALNFESARSEEDSIMRPLYGCSSTLVHLLPSFRFTLK